YMHEDALIDPYFGEGKNPDNYAKPVQILAPRCAALGMKFYTGTMFPKEYRNQIFIAEHGSGVADARVTLVRLDGNKAVAYEPFVTGWKHEGRNWGRPTD